MPKKLNISSNERVDLEDFNRASAEYTQESDNFERQKLFQARRSLVASGFRIEISDQTISPGQFTIYNGLSLDRSGNILNNEQQVSDARTMTLSGGGSSFYIEIEFVEGESDVDTRAFWDPTFSGNTPPGKEFSLNVATRVTPNWQVVSPVSTAGFAVDITDINSAKVPIAVLTTDGANQIVGFTVQNASTVLEEDVLSSVTEIRVLDSTLFPTTGDATLDFGGANPETVSIVGNDLVNGIITFGGPTSFAHNAGAILRETVVPASFVPESKLAAPSADEDRRRRLYAGDESRGGALARDSQDIAARSDLAIKSLKDHVDFLAAQIREMKFGDPRTDVNGGLPPASWTNTRYYDPAGGLAGARGATLTIGDGSLSYGDINTTSSNVATALQTAHDALDATNGGTVYVKDGDYVWNGTLTISKTIEIVFGHGVRFVAGTYSGNIEISNNTSIFRMQGMPERSDTGAAATELVTAAGNTTGTDITLNNCVLGRFDVASSVPADSIKILARDCIFRKGTTTIDNTIEFPLDATASRIDSAVFEDCTISYSSASANSLASLVYGNIDGIVFRRCVFDAAEDTNSVDGYVFVPGAVATAPVMTKGMTFESCKFVDTVNATVERFIDIDLIWNITNVSFRDCIFDGHFDATPTVSSVVKILSTSETVQADFDDCDFSPMGTNTIPGTTSGSRGRILDLQSDYNVQTGDPEPIVNIRNCVFGREVDGATVPAHFVDQIWFQDIRMRVLNCQFRSFTSAIRAVNFSDENGMKVDNCHFINDVSNATNWVAGGCSAITFDSEFTFAECSITNNYFYMEAGQADTVTDRFIFLDVEEGPSDDNSNCMLVMNNIMQLDLYGGELRFVEFVSASFRDPEIVIQGNQMDIGSGFVSQPGTNMYAIDVGLTSGGYGPKGSIDGNRILCGSTSTGNGEQIGIRVRNGADDDGHSTALSISNNTMRQTIGGGASSVGYGIWWKGYGVNMVGNDITMFGGTDGNGSACIHITGHGATITSNYLFNEDVDLDFVIKYLSTDPVAANAGGQIIISNNNMKHRSAINYGIQMEIDHDEIHNINISNNNMVCVPTTSHRLIEIDDVTSTGGSGGYSITGNTFWINTSGTGVAGSANSGVYLNLDNATRGANVSNNTFWCRSSHTGLRATNSGAIEITNGDFVVCNGNTINNWEGTGVANRASIYISSTTQVVCNSNNVGYSGSAGENSIRVTSCSSGNVSANEPNGGGVDTTGSTVTTTGSNAA